MQARTGRYPPKQADLFVEREIQVGDDDLRNLVLEMRTVEPTQLSGTVILEDGSTRPFIVGLPKRGQDDGYGGVGLSKGDGSFVVDGLLPGHYWVEVLPDPRGPHLYSGPVYSGPVYSGRPYSGRLAEEWRPILVSATLNGKDILKEGFDLDGTDPGALRLIVRLP